ncbi:hypothetical protein EDB84DRAFT_694478 [Lactarius hengduanensis]|nr:hypothetical protein EDB84DRAFT_694478 [Lactarius hengduanensis]
MTPASPHSFQSMFGTALANYEKQTGKDLSKHPFADKLRSCDSADSVLHLFQEQAQAFDEFRNGDRELMKRLGQTVYLLYVLASSATLNEGIGLVFPPAKVVFSGICILLTAAKDVSSSYDALVDLFECVESFLKRLEVYTEIPFTSAMEEVVAKIMVELLSVLALATKQIKQGRFKKFAKKLLGESEIEAVLHRLDRLTQEEARTTVIQTLEIVHGLVNNIKVVMDDGKASTENIRQVLVTMHEMATEINKMKRDQLQKDVQSLLSPPDPSTNHEIASEVHHRGTTIWYFKGRMFAAWKASGSLLWVHGKPGSGKSILISAIIRDIEETEAAPAWDTLVSSLSAWLRVRFSL